MKMQKNQKMYKNQENAGRPAEVLTGLRPQVPPQLTDRKMTRLQRNFKARGAFLDLEDFVPMHLAKASSPGPRADYKSIA